MECKKFLQTELFLFIPIDDLINIILEYLKSCQLFILRSSSNEMFGIFFSLEEAVKNLIIGKGKENIIEELDSQVLINTRGHYESGNISDFRIFYQACENHLLRFIGCHSQSDYTWFAGTLDDFNKHECTWFSRFTPRVPKYIHDHKFKYILLDKSKEEKNGK